MQKDKSNKKSNSKARKTENELGKLGKKSKKCYDKCDKNIFDKTPSMTKKRKKCAEKKEKAGINYKKCLKEVGINLDDDLKNYIKCTKTKCSTIDKKYKKYENDFF